MRTRFLLVLAALSLMFLAVKPAAAQTCAAGAAHCVNLTFVAPTGTPAATGYYMYRATGACATGLTFMVLNTTPFTTLTYQDSSAALVPNGIFCYQVTAVDAAGVQSLPSNQAQANIPGPPGVPTGLTVSGVT